MKEKKEKRANITRHWSFVSTNKSPKVTNVLCFITNIDRSARQINASDSNTMFHCNRMRN